jgi:polysaccharide deacetylase family protein (PEP-CTERM system associated)
MRHIFSIDVEDWFHFLDLPGAPSLQEWNTLPSHVEADFRKLLWILAEEKVTATCFFLGWVAERFPHLVWEAMSAGHEIASHGYAHRLTYQLTPQDFHSDVLRAKMVLEDVSGRPVLGYRTPGFSITSETPWAFLELVRAGYRYDSSIFPADRAHGGLRHGILHPHRISTSLGDLMEFPITVVECAGSRICCFGGGYLRLSPTWLVQKLTRRLGGAGRAVNFYVHPREINPHHPRLPMPAARRFKSYVNLRSMESKLRAILREFSFTTFAESLGFLETGSQEAVTAPGGHIVGLSNSAGR